MSPLPRIGAAPADAAALWRQALQPTGCVDGSTQHRADGSTARVDVHCLRSLPARTLAKVHKWGDGTAAFGMIPLPTKPNGGPATDWLKFIVEDGVTLTREWAVDVPLMGGGCREQGDFGPPEMTTAG